ncbi:MAG: hypothetical protein K2Y37_14330 [Pirellulales bacterium]|nr:hypothetical protein [Pirellulales bacterium]
MELQYALLALNAEQMPGGRLHIFGGDFDVIGVPTLPAVVPPFYIVAKLRVQPDEVGKDHKLEVVLKAPGEEPRTVGSVPLNTVRNEYAPGKSSGSTVIIQVGMAFEKAGDHVFRLVVDGAEMGSVSLLLTVGSGEK